MNLRAESGWRSGARFRQATWLALVAAATAAVAADDAWDRIASRHFLVLYRADRDFAGGVARRAERYYETIGRDLGYARRSRFWLWNRRVTIRIHASREAFAAATGAPEWSHARANYAERRIDGYHGQTDFLETVLPHELAHLVFREFVGFGGDIPRWLDEGFAQWQEQGGRAARERLARRLAATGRLMNLSLLTSLNPDARTPAAVARLFYAQSFSLVAFLITEHGRERFGTFCGHLRDGKPLGDALRLAYPDRAPDLDKLEQAWRRYLAAAGERL